MGRLSTRLGDSGGPLWVLLSASLCGTWVLAGPVRPLVPTEPPSLRLPPAAVRAAISEDRRLADNAPNSPLAAELDASLLAQGRADHELLEAQTERARGTAARRALAERLVAEVGMDGLLALRARAVVRFEQALSDAEHIPDAEVPGIVGLFPNQLANVGVTSHGVEVAPPFVTRVLYKARWNLLHGWQPAHGLSPIERRAFFGWQALHAGREPLTARVAAARQYAQAGGDRAPEALGVLLFQAGQFSAAEQALKMAADQQGHHVRLRNYLAGVALSWRQPRPTTVTQGI